MQPFIPATVFLLCLILGNWDKLAVASDNSEFDENELQLSAVLDSVDTLYRLFSYDEFIADYTVKSKGFSFTQETEGNSNDSSHQYYIVHGWQGNQYERWINDTASAILKQNDNKVIRFDWSSLAALEYYHATKAVKSVVGKQLGKHIVSEYNKGKLELDKLTLIGHGLGAHLVGIAGKTVFKELGKKVGKIVAPSPAGPSFHVTNVKRKLQKDDAQCVIVIHTDRLLFGYKFLIGGLDFSANGGFHQPGCTDLLAHCSHKRSSLYLPEAFNKIRYDIEVARSFDPNSPGLRKLIEVIGGDCTGGNAEYSFTTRSEFPFLSVPVSK